MDMHIKGGVFFVICVLINFGIITLVNGGTTEGNRLNTTETSLKHLSVIITTLRKTEITTTSSNTSTSSTTTTTTTATTTTTTEANKTTSQTPSPYSSPATTPKASATKPLTSNTPRAASTTALPLSSLVTTTLNSNMSWWSLEKSNKASTSEFTTTESTIIVSTNASTYGHDGENGQPNSTITSSMAWIFLSMAFILVVGGLTIVYLRYKRNLSYIPCTIRSCTTCLDKTRKRIRTSSTGSHGRLTTDDATSVDLPEPRQELFSICDQDGGDDGRPSKLLERRGTEDDYFYDEIFERSAFVDERTNRSNKQLTIENEDNDDDDELDIPDLVFKGHSSRI